MNILIGLIRQKVPMALTDSVNGKEVKRQVIKVTVETQNQRSPDAPIDYGMENFYLDNDKNECEKLPSVGENAAFLVRSYVSKGGKLGMACNGFVTELEIKTALNPPAAKAA